MSKEKRKTRRIPVKIPVGIYLKDRPYEVIDAEILDISEGGAFVHCRTEILLGKEVLIEIRFAETKILEGTVIEHERALKGLLPMENVQEESVIRWTAKGDARPGFGIQFTGLKSDKAKFLERLVVYFEQLEKAGANFE